MFDGILGVGFDMFDEHTIVDTSRKKNHQTATASCLTVFGMLSRPSRSHRLKQSGMHSHKWMRELRASPGTQLKLESLQSCFIPAVLCSVCHLTKSDHCSHSCTLLRKHLFKGFTTKPGWSYEGMIPWKPLEVFPPTSPWRRRLRTKLCQKVSS